MVSYCSGDNVSIIGCNSSAGRPKITCKQVVGKDFRSLHLNKGNAVVSS